MLSDYVTSPTAIVVSYLCDHVTIMCVSVSR